MANNRMSLIAETLELTCKNNEFPTLERIGCAQKWLAVKLSDGRCGYSFLFFGEHAVYGNVYAADCEIFHDYLGMPVDRIFTFITQHLPQNIVSTKNEMLYGCFSEALINALSQNINEPNALIERGGTLFPSSPCILFDSTDCVVLIGAGMLMKESVQAQAEVHIVDMRDPRLFSTLDMTENYIRCGTGKAHFHDSSDLSELLQRASVVCVTGCTLANGTFWDIARQLHERKQEVRKFVLFGPSAQAPMELLAENGVTHVVTSRVENADAFMDELQMLPLGFPITSCQKYNADITHVRRMQYGS